MKSSRVTAVTSPAEPQKCRDLKKHLFGLNPSHQTHVSPPDHWDAFALQDHCVFTSHVLLPSVNPGDLSFNQNHL